LSELNNFLTKFYLFFLLRFQVIVFFLLEPMLEMVPYPTVMILLSAPAHVREGCRAW